MNITLASFLLCSAALSTAYGASFTQTVTVPSSQSPFSTNISVQGFDPTLGTLNGVNILLSTLVNATFRITNFGLVTETANGASASIPVSLTGPNGLLLSSTATSASVLNLAVNPYAPSSPSSSSVFVAGPAATASATTDVATGLASYTGAGLSIPFTVSAMNGTFSGTGGADLSYGGQAFASETIAVTYSYTALSNSINAVPEPGVMLTAGTGLMCLAFALKFVNKKTGRLAFVTEEPTRNN